MTEKTNYIEFTFRNSGPSSRKYGVLVIPSEYKGFLGYSKNHKPKFALRDLNDSTRKEMTCSLNNAGHYMYAYDKRLKELGKDYKIRKGDKIRIRRIMPKVYGIEIIKSDAVSNYSTRDIETKIQDFRNEYNDFKRKSKKIENFVKGLEKLVSDFKK